MHNRKTLNKIFIIFLFFLISNIFYGCPYEVNYTPPPGSKDTAINQYTPGRIVVDGKIFEYDVMILPDKTVKTCSLKMNHWVQLEDIKEIVDNNIKEFIIGTGYNGMCEVSDKVKEYLKSKGVKLHILNSFDAARLFNKISKDGLAAFFHVNC